MVVAGWWWMHESNLGGGGGYAVVAERTVVMRGKCWVVHSAFREPWWWLWRQGDESTTEWSHDYGCDNSKKAV